MVNIEGEQGRDWEVSFRIGTYFTNNYFGSNASYPHRVEPILGKELTDDEIENLSNHYTVDNIWCTSCEKKFAKLETYYSDFSVMHNKSEQLKTNGALAKLFWFSIFWRIKISGVCSIKISANDLNKIKNLLTFYLDEDLDTVLQKTVSHSTQLDNFVYKVFYMGEKGNMFFPHSKLNRPNFISISEYLLVFYCSRKHLKNVGHNFFDFNHAVGKLSESGEDGFEFVNFPPGQDCEEISTKIIKFKVDLQIENWSRLIRKTVKKRANYNVTPVFTQAVIHKFVHGDPEIKDGVRYTKERLALKILEVLHEAKRQHGLS
jgi:hypothetical protein